MDRKTAEVRRTEELLQWVFLCGSDVGVTQLPDGTLADRSARDGGEVPLVFRGKRQLNAVYGAILKDEEGKLGVLGIRKQGARSSSIEETRDLLAILVNQATVAVRNAQLYQQVPLSGFLKPLLERQRRFAHLPARARRRWVTGVAAALIVLFLVPWRLRVGGPARVLPASRSVVAAAVDGIVVSIDHREGDRVKAGDRIAQIEEQPFRAALAEAKAALEVSDRDLAWPGRLPTPALSSRPSRATTRRPPVLLSSSRRWRGRLSGRRLRASSSRRASKRKSDRCFRKGRSSASWPSSRITSPSRSPWTRQDSSLVRAGMPAAVKLNTFPTRTLQGEVARVGARILEEGKERFVIAEVAVPNPTGELRTGMLGRAKIRVGYHNIATLLVRKPARWIWAKIWPLLP